MRPSNGQSKAVARLRRMRVPCGRPRTTSPYSRVEVSVSRRTLLRLCASDAETT